MQMRLKQGFFTLAIIVCCPFLLASTNGTQSGPNKNSPTRPVNQKQDFKPSFFSNMFARIQKLFGKSFAQEKTQKAKNWMDALTPVQKQKLFDLLKKIYQEWTEGIKDAGFEAEDVSLENILFFLIAHKDFLQDLQEKAQRSQLLSGEFENLNSETSNSNESLGMMSQDNLD